MTQETNSQKYPCRKNPVRLGKISELYDKLINETNQYAPSRYRTKVHPNNPKVN